MVLGKNIAHDMKSGAEGAHFFGALLLTFSFDKHSLTKGTYVIEDMRLAFNSYDRLESWTQDRNRYNLENRTVSGSRVEGTLRNETAGILTLSMPYNEGWSCTVDGKSTPLIRVNGVFTGIEL